MRKHAENTKGEQVTSDAKAEREADAKVARVMSELDETAGPEKPVDLASAQTPEPVGRIGPNGPVNVADMKPGREVDPLLGEKADVLQFLAQLTQAIEGAGIINGRFVENLFTITNDRLVAIEQAVKQNTKQTRALVVKVTETLEVLSGQEG